MKDELSKIPSHAKTGAQIRRRGVVEDELSLLTKQIGTVKQRLREMNAV